MELKEYISIFKSNCKAFVATVIIFVLAGILFQILRPLSYKAYLTLNVTRIGSQQTSDYRFDDFYRLQADEKFADTVVRWLSSERIATDILSDSKVNTAGLSAWRLSRFFKAQRLSSQVVQVSYATGNVSTAQDSAKSVLKILNRETEKLNQDQKEEYWFKLVAVDPVVKENKFSWSIVILATLALGVFIGMWVVLARHYFSKNN
jgi:capsular polysaccharide biosynthesis protein